MHRRQKLTINGVTQWRSFDSIQELVDIVSTIVRTDIAKENEKKLVTVGTYLMEWYNLYQKPKMGVHYQTNYICMINKHILPSIGNKVVKDVTVADIQRIMNTLHSASTGRQVKSIISMMLDSAIADEIYHHPNPCRDKRLRMPTAVTKREAVNLDDLSKIISLLPQLPQQLASILALLIMTGCRRSEALGARWEDIDWDKKTIHLQRVVRFYNNQPIVSEKMKTKAANRTVSLWEDFIPYLGEAEKEGYIINADGNPLTEQQYRIRWNTIVKHMKAVGIEDRFTAHQFRHTYATVAANRGDVSPKVLQGMLGHSNFNTTMNIYASFDAQTICDSSHKLGQKYTQITLKSCTKIANSEINQPLDL